MSDEERSAEMAALRKRLRTLDREVNKLRDETKFYLRMGFGRDIKDIQLSALEEERITCLREISKIDPTFRAISKTTSNQHRKKSDWLLMPLALGVVMLEAIGKPRPRISARKQEELSANRVALGDARAADF